MVEVVEVVVENVVIVVIVVVIVVVLVVVVVAVVNVVAVADVVVVWKSFGLENKALVVFLALNVLRSRKVFRLNNQIVLM